GADDLDPGGVVVAGGGDGGGAAGAGAVAELDAAWADEDGGEGGGVAGAVAHHDAGLADGVDAGVRADAGHDGVIAADGEAGEVEIVGRVADDGAVAGEGPG